MRKRGAAWPFLTFIHGRCVLDNGQYLLFTIVTLTVILILATSITTRHDTFFQY